MKNNKVYFPKDAIAKHEDFDMWYEDGELFLHFEGKWENEKDQIAIIGRMGGEVACIKPDYRCLTYYLRLERYEHCLHTYRIFNHYYIEGMLWDVYGSLESGGFNFVTEDKDLEIVKEGHVRLVDFRDKGECYEVRVKDLAKLRIAAISAVAIGIKEEWKGLSEGEENPNKTWYEKIKDNVFSNKGKTYEQVLREAELEEARNLVLKDED